MRHYVERGVSTTDGIPRRCEQKPLKYNSVAQNKKNKSSADSLKRREETAPLLRQCQLFVDDAIVSPSFQPHGARVVTLRAALDRAQKQIVKNRN